MNINRVGPHIQNEECEMSEHKCEECDKKMDPTIDGLTFEDTCDECEIRMSLETALMNGLYGGESQ